MKRRHMTKLTMIVVSLGFLLILGFAWADEVFDLPHLLVGAAKTPVNYVESIIESVAILLVWAVVISLTAWLAKRVERYETLLAMCAGCKRVRDGQGHWIEVEEYLGEAVHSQVTHGLCGDCMERLYPGRGSRSPGD
jgi:hypothetical protein